MCYPQSMESLQRENILTEDPIRGVTSAEVFTAGSISVMAIFR